MSNQPVAIITGASRGMGAACARKLAEQGYQLALLSTSGAKEVSAELNALSVTGSVTNPDDLQCLVTATMDQYGRIDAVINSTGHPPTGELLELSDDDWHNGMDMVLLNVVRMARLVTPIMQQQQHGVIVNISTFATFEPTPDFPISASLRAALASFSKLYADRYAKDGIRINNILPGFIDSYAASDDTIAAIPMARSGKVEEIAETAAFLISPGGGYITGQNIRVDGGLTRSV